MTPDYDLAPTVNYQKSALALYASKHRGVSFAGGEAEGQELYANLNPKTLVTLGQDFGLKIDEIKAIIGDLRNNIKQAKTAIKTDPSPRLDLPAPIGESSEEWYRRNGTAQKSSRVTCREDFCKRMDGRADQLFGTLDKYIAIQESKRTGERSR